MICRNYRTFVGSYYRHWWPLIFMQIISSSWFYTRTLPADLSSSGGNNQDIGKEGIRSNDVGWCWSVRVQLCLLPFPPPSRRERHQITICSCSSLLNYRWRDPDAIYCFLVRSSCIFKLLGYQCIGGCIGVMLVCQDAWIKEIIICFKG